MNRDKKHSHLKWIIRFISVWLDFLFIAADLTATTQFPGYLLDDSDSGLTKRWL